MAGVGVPNVIWEVGERVSSAVRGEGIGNEGNGEREERMLESLRQLMTGEEGGVGGDRHRLLTEGERLIERIRSSRDAGVTTGRKEGSTVDMNKGVGRLVGQEILAEVALAVKECLAGVSSRCEGGEGNGFIAFTSYEGQRILSAVARALLHGIEEGTSKGRKGEVIQFRFVRVLRDAVEAGLGGCKDADVQDGGDEVRVWHSLLDIGESGMLEWIRTLLTKQQLGHAIAELARVLQTTCSLAESQDRDGEEAARRKHAFRNLYYGWAILRCEETSSALVCSLESMSTLTFDLGGSVDAVAAGRGGQKVEIQTWHSLQQECLVYKNKTNKYLSDGKTAREWAQVVPVAATHSIQKAKRSAGRRKSKKSIDFAHDMTKCEDGVFVYEADYSRDLSRPIDEQVEMNSRKSFHSDSMCRDAGALHTALPPKEINSGVTSDSPLPPPTFIDPERLTIAPLELDVGETEPNSVIEEGLTKMAIENREQKKPLSNMAENAHILSPTLPEREETETSRDRKPSQDEEQQPTEPPNLSCELSPLSKDEMEYGLDGPQVLTAVPSPLSRASAADMEDSDEEHTVTPNNLEADIICSRRKRSSAAKVVAVTENSTTEVESSDTRSDAKNPTSMFQENDLTLGDMQDILMADPSGVLDDGTYESPRSLDVSYFREGVFVGAVDAKIVATKLSSKAKSETTLYGIKVITTDKKALPDLVWHRFSEFVHLRAQLQSWCSTVNMQLPPLWSDLSAAHRIASLVLDRGKDDKRVISKRQILLEGCIRSALEEFPQCPPLQRFLMSDTSTAAKGGMLESTPEPQEKREGAASEFIYGARVKLMLNAPPGSHLKPDERIALQNYSCAGCRSLLESESGGLLGWGRRVGARHCEYTGMAFCLKCHDNSSTAVLPYLVLHRWDFRPRIVSLMSKEYLDFTYDQPILCVSAVNPALYNTVSLLRRVRDLRERGSNLWLELAGFPEGERMRTAAGARAYLFDHQNSDYYAMRELVDLSKGAFSALPSWLINWTRHASKVIHQQSKSPQKDSGSPLRATYSKRSLNFQL